MDGSERDEGQQGRGEVLEVLGQAPAPTKPGEGPLHNPPPLDDFEADRVRIAADHLQPQTVARCRFIGLLRIVARIGEDALQPRKAELDLVKYKPRAVAVLKAGRMDDEAIGKPNVSTREWILRPFTFFPGS